MKYIRCRKTNTSKSHLNVEFEKAELTKAESIWYFPGVGRVRNAEMLVRKYTVLVM